MAEGNPNSNNLNSVYLEQQFHDMTYIVCCECGVTTESNSTGVCLGCLRTRIDLTRDISKQASLHWCKFCSRYLQPPNSWIKAELESKELLAHCLKKIKGITGRNNLRLVDAGFIWTEPHCKRLRVWVTVQTEIMKSILEQKCQIEFIVHHQMCSECQRANAQDYWRATVQLRQHNTAHKKTLLYLEQLILRNDAHKHCVRIKQEPAGLDFHFQTQDQARKLTDLLLECAPCRYKTSKELVTHDTHNNSFIYKHSFAIEVLPICRDDVVFITRNLSNSHGGISQGPLICYKLTQLIHLIDPFTLTTCDISAKHYNRDPFPVLGNSKNLQEYIVVNIEPINIKDNKLTKRHATSYLSLCDVWLMKSDCSNPTDLIHTRTHLGHVIKQGDSVLAFSFSTANLNLAPALERDLNRIIDSISDVVIIKKYYGDTHGRHRKRQWQLKRIAKDQMDTSLLSDKNQKNNREEDDNDIIEFMEDLEEDKDLRKNVSIYKKERKSNITEMDTDNSTHISTEHVYPTISLDEMLNDLCLD